MQRGGTSSHCSLRGRPSRWTAVKTGLEKPAAQEAACGWSGHPTGGCPRHPEGTHLPPLCGNSPWPQPLELWGRECMWAALSLQSVASSRKHIRLSWADAGLAPSGSQRVCHGDPESRESPSDLRVMEKRESGEVTWASWESLVSQLLGRLNVTCAQSKCKLESVLPWSQAEDRWTLGPLTHHAWQHPLPECALEAPGHLGPPLSAPAPRALR